MAILPIPYLYIQKGFLGVPVMAKRKPIRLGTMRLWPHASFAHSTTGHVTRVPPGPDPEPVSHPGADSGPLRSLSKNPARSV